MDGVSLGELIRHSRVQERLARLRKIAQPKEVKRRFVSEFKNEEYLKWTSVSCKNVDYGETHLIKGAGRLGELVDWCDDNCNKLYILGMDDIIFFEDENDAAMFTLVWK